MTDNQTPASSGQRTPEQLVQYLTTGMSANHPMEYREMVMAEVIAEAEAAGDAHMLAVIQAVIPDGPTPPRRVGAHEAPTYEMRDGQHRSAWHDSNTLIELRAYVDGRMFTARESMDPYMFEAYGFADSRSDRLEEFIQHFIRVNFGALAVSDEASYRYFRERVWIVQPTDAHDFKRCRASHDDTTGKLWPRCLGGTIVRSWPQLGPIPGAGTVQTRRDAVMGSCPCRCHRNQSTAARMADIFRMPPFHEDLLDENGRPR